jgi:PAS domain S-box-containing protein
MHSFLGVPVRYEGQPLGSLYLTEKNDGGEFTEEDESMLLLLADQAAMAMQNAALHAAAEDERARLRTLVETSPVGVLIVRKGEKEVRLVNCEAARLLGRSDPQIAQVEIEMLQAHERHGIYRRRDGTEYEPEELPLNRALVHGERVTAEEFFVELPDGSVLPTITKATPVFDADGKITGAIATIQDITPIEELKTPLTAIKGSAAMALGPK